MSRVQIDIWEKIYCRGVTTVRVQCPKCHLWADLDHDIDDAGNITPSLDCARETCDFHDHAQLVEWK